MLIQANDATKKIAPIINNSWIFCVGLLEMYCS